MAARPNNTLDKTRVLQHKLYLAAKRSQPVRRVWIAKPGTAKRRPLGIAAVRDRVVQQAIKIVIEPIVEADFLPCSFGFRPKRSAHQALQAMGEAERGGRTWWSTPTLKASSTGWDSIS
jgi:RNA-directed DNA polymerase